MPITFACPCGKQLKVGDEHAGKRAKCPACAAVLEVPTVEPSFPAPPPAPAANEDDAYKMLDDGPAAPAPAARRDDPDDFRRPSALAPPTFRRDPDGPPRARFREVSEEEEAEPSTSSGGPHFPTVFGGLFSMALGGLFCWLRGGVSILGIFLLVAGLISVVKGLLGYEEG